MSTHAPHDINQAQEVTRLSNLLRHVERCIQHPGPDQDILKLRNEREVLRYELEMTLAGG